MEASKNQFYKDTQEAHDDNLEVLRDKIEYLDVKSDFFENQTFIINEIIYKIELKEKELLKEEQEMTDKLVEGAKVKKNLVNILKDLKNQQQVNIHDKKDDGTFIKINGFYHCPECPYKTNFRKYQLKNHINAVHRKLKPYKCTKCTKGKFLNTCNYFVITIQFSI